MVSDFSWDLRIRDRTAEYAGRPEDWPFCLAARVGSDKRAADSDKKAKAVFAYIVLIIRARKKNNVQQNVVNFANFEGKANEVSELASPERMPNSEYTEWYRELPSHRILSPIRMPPHPSGCIARRSCPAVNIKVCLS